MSVELISECKMSVTAASRLRQNLDKFYSAVEDYLVFQSVSNVSWCWRNVGRWMAAQVNREQSAGLFRVLEVGAGRSGFGQWLEASGKRNSVTWIAQDVTSSNLEWLQAEADEVVIGAVEEYNGLKPFDVIISTYVLEHVSNPQEHLSKLRSLLRPGGVLYIWCPRYDFPGYLCPSSRHLRMLSRIWLGFVCVTARIRSIVSRRPAFLIQTDLAAFHGPFFIDSDACHWVSQNDLRLWAEQNSDRVEYFGREVPAAGLKDWIVKRWLTCAIGIHKKT